MSYLANVALSVAKSIAESRGSGLAINIDKNGKINYKFISKEGNDERIWESHYSDVAFYLGEMANPVRFEIDVKQYENETVVNAIDNAIATKYYRTYMQNEALSRIFNISGPQQEMIVKLLYGIIAGIGITIMILLAMYGGA